ncbi:hypothetical protein LTR81_027786 [Elasticomyces elasticus]
MLKADLRIVDWKCGARTLRHTECQRSILLKRRPLIDAQITSMTAMTCVDPSFPDALRELVMLVHCHQHDAGRPKDSRLEAWKLALAPTNSAPGELKLSVEQRINELLGPLSAECLADVNGWTCKRHVGGQKVQNSAKMMQELVKSNTYSDDAELEYLLRVMEWNRTCDIHQSSKHFKWVAEWKRDITVAISWQKGAIDQPAPKSPFRGLQGSKKAPAECNAVVALQKKGNPESIGTLLVGPTSLSPARNQSSDPALYWPKEYNTCTFDIVACASHVANPWNSQGLIGAEISRPLDAEDVHDGYVYTYGVEGNAGFIKIGHTRRRIVERLHEWSFHCNRRTKLLYPSNAAIDPGATPSDASVAELGTPTTLVPHARRVEALCHAELDHRRIRIYCNGCLKQHIEWFDVSAEEVIAIIRKWSKWMATRPYKILSLKSGPKTLKYGLQVASKPSEDQGVGYAIQDGRSMPPTIQVTNSIKGLAHLDEGLLQHFLERHHEGRIWYFDEARNPFRFDGDALVPGEDEFGNADLIASSFSGARQNIFSPLTDPVTLRHLAGCFAWASEVPPIFTDKIILRPYKSFLHSVVAELSRLDTVAAVKQQASFVSSVSHELRSPLHGILGAAELLAETDLDDFQKGLADTVRACGSTLQDTLSNMLSYAKINDFEQKYHRNTPLPQSPTPTPELITRQTTSQRVAEDSEDEDYTAAFGSYTTPPAATKQQEIARAAELDDFMKADIALSIALRTCRCSGGLILARRVGQRWQRLLITSSQYLA